jgi:hypothetical protein
VIKALLLGFSDCWMRPAGNPRQYAYVVPAAANRCLVIHERKARLGADGRGISAGDNEAVDASHHVQADAHCTRAFNMKNALRAPLTPDEPLLMQAQRLG